MQDSEEEDLDLKEKQEQYYKPEDLKRKVNVDFSLSKLEEKYREKAERE